MSVLVNKKSKIVVQGFTGSEGAFHSEQMIAYGTNVVGGVTPGKGGQNHLGKPVFNTVEEAVINLDANTSIIFVPPLFAADAIMEAADAGIKIIITITEGIPVSDMIKVYNYIKGKNCKLIGPNCPGVITPGEAKVGIMPGFIFKKGRVGVVSKSGTLTYEAADQVVKQGLGISTAIGIGGDPIIGTTTKQALELLISDKDTDCVVMIGEIGGQLEGAAGAGAGFEEQVDHRLAAQQRHFLDRASAHVDEAGGGIKNVFKQGTGQVFNGKKVSQLSVFGELHAGGGRRRKRHSSGLMSRISAVKGAGPNNSTR